MWSAYRKRPSRSQPSRPHLQGAYGKLIEKYKMPPQFTPNNPVPITPKKSHKKVWALGLVIIVLILASLFIKNSRWVNYYIFHKGPPPGYCDPGPCPSAETPQSQALGSWRTYSNGTWEITVPI